MLYIYMFSDIGLMNHQQKPPKKLHKPLETGRFLRSVSRFAARSRWSPGCSGLHRFSLPGNGFWHRWWQRPGEKPLGHLGFYGDLMGFYSDLMGFYSDLMGFNGI